LPANASGYIAESAVPFDIDIAHSCDKSGLDRCYDLGLQAGLFDGYQYHGHLRYSIEFFANAQLAHVPSMSTKTITSGLGNLSRL
jgi:hypothetical protein